MNGQNRPKLVTDDALADLVRQMREANEMLVVAGINAERLAEETEAARVTAADSEERFRSLVIASSTIVWRAEPSGRVEPEPDGWLAFTGMVLNQPPRQHDWLDAVHPDDRARAHERWCEAVAAAKVYTCEHRLHRATGGYAWISARGVPILRNGVAREWIGTMTDISERIEIERAREQFMAILSHDLRGPLASVSISADALKTLELDQPYGYLVDEISRTSRRMGKLIHDIMDFARTRLGSGMPIVARPCNLAVVVAEITAEIVRVHPDRAIATSSTGDLRGEWDPGRLGQVVANLLGNAIAHGVGAIQIALVGKDREVELSVTNHGPTIPAAARATLFEAFTHDRSRNTGLGLGLYIVSEIVRGHGGVVRVTSESETTVFSVTLPRVLAS